MREHHRCCSNYCSEATLGGGYLSKVSNARQEIEGVHATASVLHEGST